MDGRVNALSDRKVGGNPGRFFAAFSSDEHQLEVAIALEVLVVQKPTIAFFQLLL